LDNKFSKKIRLKGKKNTGNEKFNKPIKNANTNRLNRAEEKSIRD
jgi:hypothetical protein